MRLSILHKDTDTLAAGGVHSQSIDLESCTGPHTLTTGILLFIGYKSYVSYYFFCLNSMTVHSFH